MLALGFGLTALAALAGARAGAVPVISLASSSGYAGAELVSSVEGQWYADGVAIPGAWGGALMITPDLEGAAIFLRVDPHIWVSDGDPGYAGSSYQSSVFGQWQADGVDIPGAVGLRWQMTPAYEGAAISLDYRPIIRIVQGAGYAGSRLRSNLPGQWFADGVAIPGSIGRDLIISPALEGAAISQDAEVTIMQSNTIQMWVPERALTAPQKANGGLWLGEDRTTVERNGADYVTAWRDKFGVRDMTQPTAANQPRAGTFRGMPAVIWDKSPAYQYLQPPAAFAPMWWLILAEFATGVEIISGTSTGSAIYTQILGNGQAALARVSFQQPDAVQSGTSAIRLNAADTEVSSGIFPMPMGSMSFGVSASASWCIGRGFDANNNRQWVGPILGAIALGVVPDLATRHLIEAYMHWRHGLEERLPANHPYRNAPPRVQ
ncbi:hypothetical protein [Ketogulonicigenium vulgare]|uniref:Uncharacterized protein n=1 Tax=Ketogulonicigenium vulgare (strain WSH-001) TaxID=759362 RepID=F9Y9Q4_KETVW|nr:hypothetical protein [Ketogulonicigenium vulgare]AEM41392.1 hypothetical protein KVU_1553 [Ketogulonicigenium vulgare WSH-001]ALJ81526.1 hypothetical protein KVH_10280 [Ketogulonicigenium vulgare]ANW34228.1 hypothetical protein KvSKV_10225 [Ketogulonicigenium vulgare]AOZ55137.1 hypothetical protein KVC_2130 [Ketogulonicigenium vulgare]